MRRVIVLSLLLHAAAVAFLVWSPRPQRAVVLPGVVSVELIGPSALEGPPPAAQAPAQARPAPPPPPRPPVEKTVVLPKEPAPAPKPKPQAAPTPAPKPAPRPEPERSYEEIMKELRQHEGDLEELTPHAPPVQTARANAAAPSGAVAGSGLSGGRGVRVDPEEAAWMRRARIHVRQSWVLAPGFRTQNLETHVQVRLDAAGHLADEPRITRRSGNPWYDDGVLRALQKASPLPAPPEAGERLFVFRPEDWL